MPNSPARCRHCGTPFSPRTEEEAFCCHGCAYAYELINSSGLSRYYDLKKPTAPVRNTPFQARDFADLAAWQGEREAAARAGGQPLAEGVLALSGVSCVGCVWLVERIFEEQAGAVEIMVNVQRGEAKLRWRPQVWNAAATAERLQQFGYLLGRLVEGQGERRDAVSALTRKIGLCALFALNAMLFSLPRYLGMADDAPLAGLFELAALCFASASLVVGGLFFGWRAWQSLRRGVLHIDLPIALGIFSAYGGSMVGWWLGRSELMYFDFVAVFIFLMLVGRWTQEATLRRNQARLSAGLGPPREVCALLPDGSEVSLPREQLAPGQRMRLAPGEFVPVAAHNGEATASLSLEWITGESEPRVSAPGEPIPAGAANVGSTAIEVVAAETWAESLLARLLETRSYDTRDPALERLLRNYIGVVLAIAFVGGATWALLDGLVNALQVFVSILVVSCPCALGVAAPLASELGFIRVQRTGVFVKSTGLWRRLGEITTLVFDKTGTLTLENPRLLNPEALQRLDMEAAGALRQLTRDSLHPISRALRISLTTLGLPAPSHSAAVASVTEFPGYGLALSAEGTTWTLGRPGWKCSEVEAVDATAASTNATTELRRNGALVAAFCFEDDVRDEARAQFDAWRCNGLRLAILSGDRRAKVAAMAEALGMEAKDAHGEMSPQQKADWIAANATKSAMMLGDGLNDSLAFDAAHVRGTPVVDRGLLESKADFFFLDRGLNGVSHLLETAQSYRKTVRAIFAFALAYNAVTVALCLAGTMNPLLAAILMPASSLVTIAMAATGMRGK